jgi:hypothetical protein
MERLRHDVAWATTLHILEVFNFRDEERNEAFGLIYERVKAGLLAYDQQTQDLLRRLKPLNS